MYDVHPDLTFVSVLSGGEKLVSIILSDCTICFVLHLYKHLLDLAHFDHAIFIYKAVLFGSMFRSCYIITKFV